MNINDLEVCEVVDSGNQIIGGKPIAFAAGRAKAKPGKAKADAIAVGVGDSTSAATYTGASASPKFGAAYYGAFASAQKGTKVSYDTAYGTDYAAKSY
ncbi:hypothetical protein Riv7116_0357 [Rivularia sp. PCC 7116]|uniref:hypothetical protein n=1 Tax=Rivularia sp. PCC 7116 TaxID=373994 RepID=UPI00029ED731|nr:hypothetical protein [Rivularia sp. PCC 7116]AFY52961.1 hypothetical protein Riv7116_0357 [Rivularia sp. PCC 7116]